MGLGVQKTRVLVFPLDRSSSMNMPDESGVAKKDVVKDQFNKGMKLFFEALQRSESSGGGELLTRAMDTYMAVGYFGEDSYDDSKRYLFKLATGKYVDTVYNLYQEFLRDPNNFQLIDEGDYEGISSNGTDVGQLVKAVSSAIEEAKMVAEAKRLRTWVIVLGDGCFNKYKGEHLTRGNVYEKVSLARQELSTVLSGVHRGVVFLIYGQGIALEDDSDMCPARAALMADLIRGGDEDKGESEIHPSIVRALAELEKKGVLDRSDNSIFDFEVPIRGGVVRDYAVWRLRDLHELATVIFKATTS